MQRIINKESSILEWIEEVVKASDNKGQNEKPKELACGLYSGGVISIVARSNAGKTALAIALSKHFIVNGYKVTHFNADTSSNGTDYYKEHARMGGFNIIFPNHPDEPSLEEAKEILRIAGSSNQNLAGVVFIIDTLKKFTSMINKRTLSQMLGLFRDISKRGATVILLSHMNKYTARNGEDIYEGCGDLISDTDEVYYLYSLLDSSKERMDVQLLCHKKRFGIQVGDSLYFDLCLRSLECKRRIDGQDIAEIKLAEEQYQADLEIIDSVTRSLSEAKDQQLNQGELIKLVTIDTCIPQRPIKEVLNRYTRKHWSLHKGPKNANLYTLIPENLDKT